MIDVVLRPRNGLSLCSGGGGLDMGLMLAETGYHTRCFVEWDEYPRRSLIAAQRAGYFAPAPIWDDLTTFDARPFAGAIDTLIAGYPCQPFSQAGQRRGESDERHLWPDVARVARELGDGLEWIFLENVGGHVTLGAEAVLRTLWDMGFTPAVGLFTAAETGAPHERLRWFCVAHKPGRGCGIERDAAQPGGSGYADGCGLTLAHADGWDASAERQQRGGQQRFQPQGRSACRDDLAHTSPNADARGMVRRADRAGEVSGEGEGAERERVWPGLGGCSDAMANASGRQLHEPEWRQKAGDGAGSAGQDWLADAGSARPQGGKRRGSPQERDRSPAHGSVAQCGSAWVFPPGPSDTAAWGDVLSADPSRAPSFARRDVKDAALRLASLLSPDEASAVLQRAGGMAIEGILAEVVGQAGNLVEQATSFAGFRDLAHGVAQRSRSLRLLGNGVFPLAAGHAWRTLSAAHGLGRVDLEAASTGGSAETDEHVVIR